MCSFSVQSIYWNFCNVIIITFVGDLADLTPFRFLILVTFINMLPQASGFFSDIHRVDSISYTRTLEVKQPCSAASLHGEEEYVTVELLSSGRRLETPSKLLITLIKSANM